MPMITIDTRPVVDGMRARLGALVDRQLPFALARALNETAKAVIADEQNAMRRELDRPTPYALNSLYFQPATKQQPVATVQFKTDVGKGTPAEKFLGPEVLGGSRNVKRFERALQYAGLMPGGTVAVPAQGRADILDAYGNIRTSLIVTLLSYVGAFAEQGYRANATAETKAKRARRGRTQAGHVVINGVEYFVSFGRGSTRGGRPQHLAAGIWERRGIHGVNMRPVILFVSPAHYTPRFHFRESAERTVARVFPGLFQTAMADAIASSR